MPDLWLSLGSNLGAREATLQAALRELPAAGIVLLSVSSLYATAPQGFVDQPEFLNCVAKGHSDLSAHAALRRCHAIEAAHGRERTVHWGPRPLDIDLLFYDDLTSTEPELLLPHPRLWERAFVLAPLLELWPELRSPEGIPAQDQLKQLSANQPVRRFQQAELWWHRRECDLHGNGKA